MSRICLKDHRLVALCFLVLLSDGLLNGVLEINGGLDALWLDAWEAAGLALDALAVVAAVQLLPAELEWVVWVEFGWYSCCCSCFVIELHHVGRGGWSEFACLGTIAY